VLEPLWEVRYLRRRPRLYPCESQADGDAAISRHPTAKTYRSVHDAATQARGYPRPSVGKENMIGATCAPSSYCV